MGYIIGIDEVGRGPLAGPITLGIFGTNKKFSKIILKDVFENKLRDSKKLTPKKRLLIYDKLNKFKENQFPIIFMTVNISNEIIDKKGISFATNLAIKTLLKFVEKNIKIENILLDGSLKAPLKYKNQKTIIKGDEKEICIACASIIAKVERDNLMNKLDKKYPNYDLKSNKGYGTSNHIKSIKLYGLSKIHRKSFCRNIIIY